MVKRKTLKFSEPRAFPELPVTEHKCVGSGDYLSEKERDSLEMNLAILIHNKFNRHDPNAVAVLDVEGRVLGYIRAAQGAIYAPLIDQIGALQITCRVTRKTFGTTPILWLDLPKAAALKKALGL
ncbi:HIRAN domain-containing protein [Neomicrococcus lactis]|uniref:HIRAN domain-containing protein n=1 Tax=Neomicrococcus lactis TaxID=732241 RepID=UPI0023011A82|nr:HIRAN domain-containing protein [Neomicrococcus lactis]